MSMRISFFEVMLSYLVVLGVPALILFLIVRWGWRMRRSADTSAKYESANHSELLELREQLGALRSEIDSLGERQEFLESLLQRSR